MKVLIVSDCIGPKGLHLSRGETVEVERDVAAALIGAGRAVSPASTRGADEAKAIAQEVTGAPAETTKPGKK